MGCQTRKKVLCKRPHCNGLVGDYITFAREPSVAQDALVPTGFLS